MFLNKQSWVDARIIFSKACEMKGNSPLAWLGLGNFLLINALKKELHASVVKDLKIARFL